MVGITIQKFFVASLENIAARFNMSDDVAGATLLAFGSSAPELFTSLFTILWLQSMPSFGIGNIVGSALFQVLAVIGFATFTSFSKQSGDPSPSPPRSLWGRGSG